MRRLRRRLRALADLAVAGAVTIAPVLFPRSLDDPQSPRACSADNDTDSGNGRGSET